MFNPDHSTTEDGVVVKRAKIPAALRTRPDGSTPLVDVHASPDATLAVDPWVRHVIRQEVESGGSFESTVAMDVSKVWPSFVRELFAEMYDPSTPELEELGPNGRYVAAVRAKAHEVPQWEAMAERCAADGFRCGMAVDTIARAIAADFPPPPEDPDEARERADEARQEADANPDDAAAQAAAQTAEDHADLMEAMYEHAIAELADDPKGAVRRALKDAVATVTAELDSEDRMMVVGRAGWGHGRGNALEVAGPRQALIDALRSDPHLRTIVELAGRMKDYVRAVRSSRTRLVPEEIVDVEVGGDWSRFVGGELAGLGDPDLELYLMRRAMERGVFQYALEGNEDVARGPIVFCLDESASMKGQKDAFAKAAAFAMAEIAGREKRPFTLQHFASSVVRRDHYRPPSPMHVEELVGMLTFFANGGTSIDAALNDAARIVEQDSAMGKADVILLSDGASGHPKAALARCEAANARVHGVAVGQQFPEELREACVSYAYLPTNPTADNLAALEAVFSI